jgi:hypothetical protein
MSQRVVQYQAVIQMAQMAPDIYDLPQLHRNMLEVLGIKNAEKLIPLESDMKPTDPVSENQAVLKLKPVKAFLHQDHESHIAVHTAVMQDPTVMALIGQNPKAPQMQAALTAHIAEHVGYAMRQKVEQQLGMPLPPEDEKLPPQMEVALSAMMAQAAQQIVEQSKAQAAQQQAQQQAQDPVIQMQQQELQIKQQEVQIKQQVAQAQIQNDTQELQLKQKKMEIDAAAKADETRLKEEEMKARFELEGFKAGQQASGAEKKMQADQEREGVRMGIDIAKSRYDMAQQDQPKTEPKT